MSEKPPFDVPLQPSAGAVPPSPSEGPSESEVWLPMREAARRAGCSESTLRRLVKAGEVPFTREETRTGFRYLFQESSIPIIAHKAAMRRPAGRPSAGSLEGSSLQPSKLEGPLEASQTLQELATLRAERDLLKAENARLWAQLERLTETMSRLALPPAKPSPVEESEGASASLEPAPKYTFWDWFFGRPPKSRSDR